MITGRNSGENHLVLESQRGTIFMVVLLELMLRMYAMRFINLLVAIIVVGLIITPALAATAVAAKAETCADGEPCPTDAELEDSCSDEEESI